MKSQEKSKNEPILGILGVSFMIHEVFPYLTAHLFLQDLRDIIKLDFTLLVTNLHLD